MKKSHAENTVGPWAKQKLDALESYLDAYHKVMKNQKFYLVYIDAFAGAGWSRVRSATKDEENSYLDLEADQAEAEAEFIAGSPLRALNTGRGFDRYFFFDADPRRARQLEILKAEHPESIIHVQVGDANEGVQRIARQLAEFRDIRGVAFLDPYGPNLHWQTVQALADTRQFDVIINFPLAMAINRLITKSLVIRDNWIEILDNCFGTHEWYDLACERTADLFLQHKLSKSSGTAEKLLGLYHRRLKASFGYVVDPSLVQNTRGAPLYYLMWAASNQRGVPIAKHILKLGSRIKPPKRL